VDFCSACGAAVGRYTNWLPYPYLFSVGHVLRIGTSGDFKQSALTITGFLFLGLVEYTVFAPIYWFMLARGINHHGRFSARQLPEESPTEGDQG
jgi:hypothetical protein